MRSARRCRAPRSRGVAGSSCAPSGSPEELIKALADSSPDAPDLTKLPHFTGMCTEALRRYKSDCADIMAQVFATFLVGGGFKMDGRRVHRALMSSLTMPVLLKTALAAKQPEANFKLDPSYSKLLAQMTLARTVDSFLVYVTDLLTIVFQTKPGILGASNKMVKVASVLNSRSIEKFRQQLAEQEVMDLAYSGMREMNRSMKKMLGFGLFTSKEKLDHVVLLNEQRNVIVHNRGVINWVFLSRVPRAKYAAGDQVMASARDISDALCFLLGCAAEIDGRAASEFDLPTVAVEPQTVPADARSSPLRPL